MSAGARIVATNLGALYKAVPSSIKAQAIYQLAEAARAYWIHLAQTRLHSSTADYINAIQPIEMGDGEAVISLVGWFANAVENGMSARDMHEALLGQTTAPTPVGMPGIHLAEDGGRYRAIPFRHKTPGTTEVGGMPMGGSFAAPRPGSRRLIPPMLTESVMMQTQAAEEMGRTIHKIAKKLQEKQALGKGLAPKLSGHHATDIYAGMRKMVQQTTKAKQATYMTFRMISVGPDGMPRPSGKWKHPGIEARNLAADVRAHVESIAGDVVANLMGDE